MGCLLDLFGFLEVPLGAPGVRWVNLGRLEGRVMLLKQHACAQNKGFWNLLPDHGDHGDRHEMVS